jgi:hypothetical protein
MDQNHMSDGWSMSELMRTIRKSEAKHVRKCKTKHESTSEAKYENKTEVKHQRTHHDMSL